MVFEFVNNLIEGIQIDLEILKRKTQSNKIILFQHEGDLSASKERIGNSNSFEDRFISSMRFANEEGADLFMTPEYSCPWNSIKRMCSDTQLMPPFGKLWVLGCESLSLNELSQFKSECDTELFEICFDQDLEDTNSFVDPVCYVFKAKVNSRLKNIIVVQFKTAHMGGLWKGGDIERNNLIEGKKLYVLNNTNDVSINLLTLICSEVMNFREYLSKEIKQALNWEDRPYLILHPQFNPDPNHSTFIDFRNCIFETDNKEIIALNWQLKSKIGGSLDLLSHCNARSGFYIVSDQNDLSKTRVNKNHAKGLYYFNNKRKRHSYFLSSEPHLFVINNSPVKISEGVSEQQRRDGPIVQKVCQFKDEKIHELTAVDDTQIEYFESVGCTNDLLLDSNGCVIDKERLVSLSTGKIHNGKEWYRIENIDSIQIDNNSEINRRITVARNKSPESLWYRSSYCEAIAELERVLMEKDQFPENIEDIMEDGLKLVFSEESKNEGYRFNVASRERECKYVTICYIGTASEWEASETYTQVRKLFTKRDTRDYERVVIYYKKGTNILSKFDTSYAKINETHDYDDDSIVK